MNNEHYAELLVKDRKYFLDQESTVGGVFGYFCSVRTGKGLHQYTFQKKVETGTLHYGTMADDISTP